MSHLPMIFVALLANNASLSSLGFLYVGGGESATREGTAREAIDDTLFGFILLLQELSGYCILCFHSILHEHAQFYAFILSCSCMSVLNRSCLNLSLALVTVA
mmetsp:Transcript_15729/g.34047  ORF Transcript_15729/g.34047 Transcript_15729/m.34047 type:complete len:103 (+) Transcript_15729:1848-2156(+)